MVYLTAFVIALVLLFAEVSLLPHLFFWSMVPLLVLPFLSILSLKDRTIFPIILAGIMGLFTDAISGNVIPIFSIAYLLVVIVSKIFLGKFISYGELRANLTTLSIGIAVIYGTDIAMRARDITSFGWIIPLIVNIILTFILLIIYSWIGRRFFTWVEKKTEERFR